MAQLVDLDRLRSFTDGDRSLEAELFGLFVATVDGYLGELEAALGDPGSWRAVAHGLKGAASNLGAVALAELAAAAEHAQPDPARLVALRATFAATRLWIDRQLEDVVTEAGTQAAPPAATRPADHAARCAVRLTRE